MRRAGQSDQEDEKNFPCEETLYYRRVKKRSRVELKFKIWAAGF